MKTLSLFLVLTLVAGAEFQNHPIKPHTDNYTSTQEDTLNSRTSVLGSWKPFAASSASDSFFVTGTGRDTSRVYKFRGFPVTFKFAWNDTSSSGDSVDVDCVLLLSQVASNSLPAFSQFARIESTTVAVETVTYWAPTALRPGGTGPFLPAYMLECYGGADNKKLSAVHGDIDIEYVK